MADGYLKKKLCFDLQEVIDEIDGQASALRWRENQVSGVEYAKYNDGRFHNGKHGTRWCELSLSSGLIAKIEDTVGCRVFRDVFYLWDYLDVKSLPLHIDTAEINSGKVVACCIPVIGEFKLSLFRDVAGADLVGECIYGPGEVVLIHNRKFFHSGQVLGHTRLGVHFFLDFQVDDFDESLAELLKKNALK